MIVLLNIILLLIGYAIYKYISSSYYYKINHVSIFSFVWVFIIIFTQILSENNKMLDEVTLIVLYFSWFFFLLGSFLKSDLQSIPKIIFDTYSIKKMIILAYFLFLLSLIANFSIIIEVYGNFSDLSRWANLRIGNELDLYKENNFFYTMFGSVWFIYIPIFIYLLRNKMINKYIFVSIYILTILMIISSFTRAPLFSLFIVTFVTNFYIKNDNKIPVKFLLIGVSLIIVFFIITTIAMNNDIDQISESIKIYMFGGVSAYQNLLQGKYVDPLITNYDSQFYSFDNVNYILKRIGLINSYPSYVREYDNYFETNVFTYLDCFTLDFGIIGAFLGSFIIGYISKVIYKLFIYKRLFKDLIFYSMICYYCAFIFMNNEFIRFSVLFIFVFLNFIFFVINLKLKK